MTEKYEKKEIYEFCQTRNIMVRLDVIQATVTMPDMVQADVRLVPVECNRSAQCKQEKIRCIVYDPDGQDPCPEAWKGD